jgi:phosphoadenosine phosphosulfate reductase
MSCTLAIRPTATATFDPAPFKTTEHDASFLNADALNADTRRRTAREVIRLALARARNPIVTTSFGQQSAVLLHLLAEQRPDIPVVWIDTTFNTRATMKFADELTTRLVLNLKEYGPQPAWTEDVPERADPRHAEFTRQVKLEPLARALDELKPDLWFSSLRRDQTEHRASMRHFNPSAGARLKVCPLIDWSEADMDVYRHAFNLPGGHDYHDPTKVGPRRECGLHLEF